MKANTPGAAARPAALALLSVLAVVSSARGQVSSEANLTSCLGSAAEGGGYDSYDKVPSPICVELFDTAAPASTLRMPFNVDVDDFSLLEITRGNDATTWMYSDLIETRGWTDVGVRVQVGNRVSEARQFTWKNEKQVPLTAAFLTVVVGLEDGNVVDIDFDDGCEGCGSSLCGPESMTCGIAFDDCDSDDLSCNPKLYVAWIGTDASGQYTTSAGRTWSRFRQFSIGEIYKNAARTSSESNPVG